MELLKSFNNDIINDYRHFYFSTLSERFAIWRTSLSKLEVKFMSHPVNHFGIIKTIV